MPGWERANGARSELSCWLLLVRRFSRSLLAPAESAVVELRLVAQLPIGGCFRREMACVRGSSLLISADTLQQMAAKYPESLAVLRFFFFFSSRRRHTRCSRDWSSDVCSSDLEPRNRLVPSRSRYFT